MPIKPSEIKFNIPVRMYDPSVWDVDEEEEERRDKVIYKLTGGDNKKPHRYRVEWRALPIEKIKSWGGTFYKMDDFDIVLNEGADATMVTMDDGDSYFCHWRKKEFEKQYDAHIAKLDKELKEEEEAQGSQVIEINDDNIKELKSAIKYYERIRKQQKAEEKLTTNE